MSVNSFQFQHFDQGVLIHIAPGILMQQSNKRINQQKAANGTCWFSCITFLALQSGKNYPPSQEFVHMNAYLQKLKDLAHVKAACDGIDCVIQKHRHLILPNNQTIKSCELSICDLMFDPRVKRSASMEEGLPVLKKIVSDYKTSPEQAFIDFSTKYWKSQQKQIECELLNACKIDIAAKYDLLTDKCSRDLSFAQLSLDKQLKFLQIFNQNVFKDFYGLKHSSWTPYQGINQLVSVLKEQGPQVLGGFLGKHLYSPQKIKLINEYDHSIVYGWEPGAFCEDQIGKIAHCIILVGANKTPKQEVVYFIDPADESQLNQKRKVYVMSYLRLCQNVLDYYGRHAQKNNEPLFTLYLPK